MQWMVYGRWKSGEGGSSAATCSRIESPAVGTAVGPAAAAAAARGGDATRPRADRIDRTPLRHRPHGRTGRYLRVARRSGAVHQGALAPATA